ncbi:MAG TPA: AsmA family protein, partial [Planctomycetota bacterium]|nr:AsmA family protein [Planctomycetota bacterium]
MNRYIRKRFLIGLVIVLALAVAGYVTVRLRIDPEVIRQQAVRTLSEYLDAEVTIEGATFDPVLGLRIEGLSVRVSDDNGTSKLLAVVPCVKLSHHLGSMFSGELSYRDITLEDAEIWLERAGDGRSNIERLIRAMRRSAAADRPCPTLRLERAQFHYADHSLCDPDGRPLAGTFRNVSGSVVPLSSRGGKYRANVTGKDPDLGMWTVRDATFDTTAETVDFRATSARIAVNDKLRERMNGRAAEVWDLYGPEGGTVKVEALFRYDGSAERTLDYEIHLHVEGVSTSYALFPYRFDEATGTMICRADGVELENLVGRSGPMKGTFNGRTQGYAEGCPLSIRIEGENIPLDAKLRAAFDADRQEAWDELSPRGSVNAVCRLDREEPCEPIRVRVLAGESPGTRVNVEYAAFPYALALEGRVFFDAGTVRIVQPSASPEALEGLRPGMLLAWHGDTVLGVQGGVEGGDPYRRVDLVFEVPEGQSVPLDEGLKRTLSKAMQELWDELALSGTTRGRCRIQRTDPKQPELDVALELTDFRSRIRYEGFPYELGHSEGSLTFERTAKQWPNGRIVVRDVRATRGDATVAFDGEITGLREGGCVDGLDLNIRGANLPLDDDLRRAISEKYRATWDYLAPTPESRINVTCKVQHRNDDTGTDFTLKLDTVDSSLMCADFPYRVDGLRGSAEYRRNVRYPDGMLHLSELTSDDGKRRVRVSGVFEGFAEGRKLDRMGVSIEGRGIALDARLREALAAKDRETFDRFRPEGV